MDVILKRFDDPDEVVHFDKGKFETVTIGGMTIGRATYKPPVGSGPRMSAQASEKRSVRSSTSAWSYRAARLRRCPTAPSPR